MEPERWKKVERLYHAALELTENERASFLLKSCSDDNDLRQEIESLRTQEKDAEPFLEADALGGAATRAYPTRHIFVRRCVALPDMQTHGRSHAGFGVKMLKR